MPTLPNWNLSHQSRARMTELLQSASALGLDPDAVASGGLAAFQALIALKRAHDAGEGAARDALIVRTQEALRGLDPGVHHDLLQQVQARILALQGRGGDTEVAHVTPGEIVLPKVLQTPAVMGALREAAAAADIPLDQLRVGSGVNKVNSETGAAEFAWPGVGEDEVMPEIQVEASRSKYAPRPDDAELVAKMMISEAVGVPMTPDLMAGLSWSVINRLGQQGRPGDVRGVIYETYPTKAGPRYQYNGVEGPQWRKAGSGSLGVSGQEKYAQALDIAKRSLDGEIPDPTGGATHFYTGTLAKRPIGFFADKFKDGHLKPLTEIGGFAFSTEKVDR